MQAIAAVAAPMTVIIGANAYFTGFMYRAFITEYYGLSSSFLEDSVQVTMARGFACNILCLVILFFIVVFSRFSDFLFIKLIRFLFPRQSLRARSFLIHKSSTFRNKLKFLSILQFSFSILTFGLVSSAICSTIKLVDAETKLQNSCSRCFVYNVRQGSFVGVMIGQDNKISAIRTRKSLLIVKNDDIKLAKPVTYVGPLGAGMFTSVWKYDPQK